MDKAVRVPAIRQLTPENVPDVVRDIVKWVNTRQGLLGDGKDRAVTLRELQDMGLAPTLPGTGGTGGGTNPDPGGGTGVVDPPTPPTPTNLVALGTPTAILLSWDMPPYRRVLFYEVWRGPTNALGDATLLATPTAQLHYDPVTPGSTYYYWVRARSDAGLYSPYNALLGTLGQAGYTASDLLSALTGQVTSSQLATALSSRIDLIDAASSVPGSVNSRVADLQGQIDVIVAATTGDLSDVIAALTTETTARIAGDAAETAARTAAIAAVNSDVAAANAAIVAEQTTRASADSALSTSISGLTTTVTNNFSTLNAAVLSANQARADGDAALSSSLDAVVARLNNFAGVTGQNIEARVATDRQARVDGDAALATSITQLSATVTANNSSLSAAIQNEATVRAAADGTLSNQVSTVQTAVNGNTAAVQTLTTSVNGLRAQYTVKVDVNGYVSGFGLASEPVNGTVISQFLIRADQFAIASPTGPGITPRVPFVVRTTPTTIGGITLQPGVYISSAAIEDLSVDSGKIISLVANKITAGFINAAIGLNGGSVFGARLYSGGTTTVQTDPNGNVTGFVANNPSFAVENGLATFEVAAFRVRNGNTVETPFEISGGVVRIKDANIANVIQAANYVPNVDGWRIDKSGLIEAYNLRARGAVYGGNFTEVYAWPASGGGFHLGPSGLLLGNGNTGQYLQVTADGRLFAPGLTIVEGSATFSGSLSAATGTFSGSLSAATGTFSGSLTASAINAVNTINLAGNAVTVPAGTELGSNTAFSTTETQLLSLQLDSQSQPVYLHMAVGHEGQGSVPTLGSTVTYRVKNNGTIVKQFTLTARPNSRSEKSMPVYIPAPGAGLRTYTLTAQNSVGGGTVTAIAGENVVFALGTKR